MSYLPRDYTKRIYVGRYWSKDFIIPDNKEEYITCDRNGNIYCTAGSVIFKLTPTKNKYTFRKCFDMTPDGWLFKDVAYIPQNRVLVAVRYNNKLQHQRVICLGDDSSDDDFNEIAQQIERIGKQNRKFQKALIKIYGELIVCSRQQKISHKFLGIKYKNTCSHTITVERLGGVFHREINVKCREYCCAVSQNGLYIATCIIPKQTKGNAIKHTINLYCAGKRSFIIIDNRECRYFFSKSILTNGGDYIFYNPSEKKIMCCAYHSGKFYTLIPHNSHIDNIKLVPSGASQTQYMVIAGWRIGGKDESVQMVKLYKNKKNGEIITGNRIIVDSDMYYQTHNISFFPNGDLAILQEAQGGRGRTGIYKFAKLSHTIFFNAEKRSDNNNQHEKIPQNFVDAIIECEL
jgi:hypothetical protein